VGRPTWVAWPTEVGRPTEVAGQLLEVQDFLAS